MFFKELACFILFSYQCSSLVLLINLLLSNSNILSCVFCFVNNFFDLFSLFQRRLLKQTAILLLFSLPCSATLDNIHPTYDKSQHYFFIFLRTDILTNSYNYTSAFYALCTILIVFYQLHLYPNHPQSNLSTFTEKTPENLLPGVFNNLLFT